MDDSFAIPKSQLRQAQVKHFVLKYYYDDVRRIFNTLLLDHNNQTVEFNFGISVRLSREQSILMLSEYFENYGYTVTSVRDDELAVCLRISQQ